MDDSEFCKIFVKADTSAVMTMLTNLLGAPFHRRSMSLPGLVLDVLPNPDTDPTSGDFLRWPTQVELETTDSAAHQTLVETTRRIITTAWNTDTPAVAACDFEDQLPWNGGIARVQG